jgi:hypothetical protein
MLDEQQAQANGAAADSQQENQRLRETIKGLEMERDDYKAALLRVLRAQIMEQDLVLPDENDCQTFDQFLPELEKLISQAKSGTPK